MPKIKGGYVLQPRIFDGSEASKMSPVTRELWFYLLRNVNHADNGKFKRGQRFFQFSDIQEDLHWFVGYRKMMYSKPQLTKALRRLCEGNMTATAKATRGIIITVCNYDVYQDPKNYEGNGEETTKEQRRNLEGNTINKNVKNERIEEKKKDKKKSFSPPTQEEVELFFVGNGFPKDLGEKAFKYYQDGNWKDGKGNQVKVWKQKMRGVWFKDENKINNNKPAKYNNQPLTRSDQNKLECAKFINSMMQEADFEK